MAGARIKWGGAGLKSGATKQLLPPPPREAREFFLLSFLDGSGIALMGSLQISTGSGLDKVRPMAVDLANSP